MKYFWATIKHKWHFILASFRTGLPLWRALIHDLSKFTRAELPHYDRQFFGDKGDPEGFAVAWHHHIIHNLHHPEHWTYIDEQGEHILPMPQVYIKEMVTDWIAFRRDQSGTWDRSKWKPIGLYGAKVHFDTRDSVYHELYLLGYDEYYFAGGVRM